MSRFLVTGAAGFIGRSLCKNLRAQGHEVWALLSRYEDGPWAKAGTCILGIEAIPNGLLDGVDGVFNLANVAHTDLTGEKQTFIGKSM
jgi:nucleoside-diphosphate-sugar epimerase